MVERAATVATRLGGAQSRTTRPDLLVVAANQHVAERWVDQVLDSGLAEDVIGLDREAWAQLPKSTSLVWRNAAKVTNLINCSLNRLNQVMKDHLKAGMAHPLRIIYIRELEVIVQADHLFSSFHKRLQR